jgi:hypothetical protein
MALKPIKLAPFGRLPHVHLGRAELVRGSSTSAEKKDLINKEKKQIN